MQHTNSSTSDRRKPGSSFGRTAVMAVWISVRATTIVWVCAATLALAAEPQRGGILPFAVNAEPPTYDCHAANTYAVIHYVAPHYSTLLKFDPENYPAIVGDLAESWSISPDNKTYTFRIRPGVVFHDGSPLTAKDIAATYERLKSPPPGVSSVRQSTVEDIARIETPDHLTVVFSLRDVNPSMLTIFASPWNCIYSAAKLRQDANFPARNVLGTGPFRFVEHVPGSHWSGTRFERYFRPGLPYLDGFRATFLTGTAVINALQGQQVFAEFRGISPAERDRLVQTLGDKARVEESSWVVDLLVTFNAEKKPFSDARVRRALSLAIDRWGGSQSLSRIAILRSVGGLIRPGAPFAATEEELTRLPGFGRDMAANRAEARRLLKEAGQEQLTFKFANRSLPMPYSAAGIFLVDQWRQIGVNVEQVLLETAAWNSALASGNFDVIMDFSNEFVDEPTLSLGKYISFDGNPQNASRSIDRTLDTLYERQKREADPARRATLIREFETRYFEQSYMVPLLWWHRIVVTNQALQNWKMSPSHLLFQDLAEVWLQK